MKITFVIRTLEFGGAERQLVELARGLHARGHQIAVVAFYPGGPLEVDLRAAGVPVVNLNKRGRYDLLGFTLRLANAMRAGRPDIVHGYLGGPNVFAALLKPFHRAVVVWGLRTSTAETLQSGWIAWFDGEFERRLSRLPALTIANSHAGQTFAIERGFPKDRIVVVPNGVDTERFKPDPELRARVRAEFGVAQTTPLIGRIGRVVPQKGYPTFLEMASIVVKTRPAARFMIVGDGEEGHAAELRAQAESLGIAENLIWAGARNDMSAVYNALDLSVSSSAYSEGVPNVIGESMAVGVPCVFTSVGDSEWTAGGHGIATPPLDPKAMAAAVMTMLERIDAGAVNQRALRESVIARLSLTALYERTESALALALRGPGHATAREPSELSA